MDLILKSIIIRSVNKLEVFSFLTWTFIVVASLLHSSIAWTLRVWDSVSAVGQDALPLLRRVSDIQHNAH